MICKHILLITFLNEPKIINLRTVKKFDVLLCITNNSFKHQSFVYTQLNGQTVLFQTIQMSNNLNVKQFYSTHKSYQVLPLRARVDLGVMAIKGTLHFPKFQYYRSLSIRLLNVISWTLVCGVGWVLPLCRDAVSVFYTPS